MITNYPKLTRLWVALLDVGVTVASYICAVYLRNLTLKFYAFGGAVDWHTHWEILVAILLVWRGLFGFQEAYVGQRFTSLKADLLVVVKTVLLGTICLELPRELGCGFMMPIERAIGNCLLRSLGL